jgi:hypothetical protein
MGHARCDRAVRLLHQASSSDRAGAGSHGWTSPVQDTHAGQSFSGSHPPPPVPARDHHRTTGSLTVILAVIPPRTTPKTGGVQTDGEANLTSEDDTSRHPMDGREATHNRSVAGSRPASPTRSRRSDVRGAMVTVARAAAGPSPSCGAGHRGPGHGGLGPGGQAPRPSGRAAAVVAAAGRLGRPATLLRLRWPHPP